MIGSRVPIAAASSRKQQQNDTFRPVKPARRRRRRNSVPSSFPPFFSPLFGPFSFVWLHTRHTTHTTTTQSRTTCPQSVFFALFQSAVFLMCGIFEFVGLIWLHLDTRHNVHGLQLLQQKFARVGQLQHRQPALFLASLAPVVVREQAAGLAHMHSEGVAA